METVTGVLWGKLEMTPLLENPDVTFNSTDMIYPGVFSPTKGAPTGRAAQRQLWTGHAHIVKQKPVNLSRKSRCEPLDDTRQ